MIRKLLVLSAPLAMLAWPALAAPSNEAVVRPAADKVVVTWTDAAPVDVYVAEAPDATLAQSKLVSDDDADGSYEFTAAPDARPYFILKDTRDGTTVRVAERVVPLQQGSNFRDIGGYAGAGGKHVKWGRIYRSGATPMITSADQVTIGKLGLKDLVDLRSREERVLAPTKIDGVRYSAVGYSMGDMATNNAAPGDARSQQTYAQFPTLLAPQIRIVFDKLLKGEGPVAYNCSAGQDRTGFTTALVLSALGVPRETIYADYHLSTADRRPEWEMPKIDLAAHPDDPAAKLFAGLQQNGPQKPRPLLNSQKQPLLAYAFAEVEAKWGSVDAYLAKEIGVGPKEIAKLRAMYLE